MPQVSRISVLIKELTTSQVKLQHFTTQQVQQQEIPQPQVIRSGLLRNVVSWFSSNPVEEELIQQQDPPQQANTVQAQTFQEKVNEFASLAATSAWNGTDLSQNDCNNICQSKP